MTAEPAPQACLEESEIRDYLQHKLEPAARHRVESHMLECPLCSEAVEGYQEYYEFGLDTELDDIKLEMAAQVELYDEQQKTPRVNALSPWVLLALICLLAALGLIFLITRIQ